jgi:hypothetical protein
MRYLILVALMLLAVPAWAVDTTVYPQTLVDSTCTDSEDVPTAVTPGTSHLGRFNPKPAIQLTGSADGFCDHDSRIRTTAVTPFAADVDFGPFAKGDIQGIFLYVDGDAVTGGDTKYQMSLLGVKPHDGALIVLQTATEATGNGNVIFAFGSELGTPTPTVEAEAPLPKTFYIQLDLNTADSWDGDISMQPIH